MSRMLKNFLTVALAMSLIVGSIGVAAADRVAYFTPGAFVGTGIGYGGPMTVSVVFTPHLIESIEIIYHTETPGIGDLGIEWTTAEIIYAQSTDIDIIAGLTLTAQGIIDAVNEAIIAAGGNPADLRPLGTVAVAGPDVTDADVIVVGGGMGGLVSAIAAAQEGASVILLERMAVLGGSTLYGGGLTVAGSSFQEEEGVNFTTDMHYEGWTGLQLDDPRQVGFYDPDLIRPLVDLAGERFNWLLDLGHEVQFHADSIQFISPLRPADWVGPWTGPVLVSFLEEQAREAGVEIHILTRGLELVQDDTGAVNGVIAESPTGPVVYSANNSVILATGGISHDQEMMERFIPDLAPFIAYSTTAPGHTGDGVRMAEGVGAAFHDDWWLIGLGITNEFAGLITSHVNGVLVDHEGNRFVKETRVNPPRNEGFFINHYTYIFNYTAYHAPYGAFFVFDSSEPFAGRVATAEANLDSPNAFRAVTIEELADAMGVPVDNLQAAIDLINAVADGDEEDPLGRVLDVNPIMEEPFYAIRLFPMDMGTIGGVITDEYYRVLNEDGEIIPGLFAVGEMSNRRYIAPMYFSGLSLMVTHSQALVAGAAAAADR